ncbi:MAG: S1 RNA-binding domain-containing protein, partial [Coriobacteriia bacterium]|nr:S1 RNA-binding domain-containing protein [Coriobacteriia bacterium]
IVDFGAFVDLGGIDGLVHISELSWSHVNHPSEVVAVGDKVEVQVLDVDLSRERISLGLKQTQDDPWKQLVKDYQVGAIMDGKVTKIVPFGAFIEIGESVEGLVHISEMARGHVEKPEDVANVGDEVKIKIMDVDLERRRISLSIRAANEELGLPDAIPYEPEEGEEGAEAVEADEEVAEAVEEAAVEEAAIEEAAVEEAAVEEAAVEEAAAEEIAEAEEPQEAAEVAEESDDDTDDDDDDSEKESDEG